MPVFSHKRTLFLLAIIGGLVIWNQNREPDPTPKPETPTPLPTVKISPPPASVEIPLPPALPSALPPVANAPAAAIPATPPAGIVSPGSVNEVPATAEDTTEDLSAIDTAIRNFRDVIGENPIGSNAEITSALLGNNLKQIKLELPAGSSLNGNQEMCDRWGTPYFFHQISATEMEIRSAGPDRQMWTGDDSQR